MENVPDSANRHCLLSPRWYFAMISMSGTFSVTFSVIFAYVADVTEEHERSTAYGLVSVVTPRRVSVDPRVIRVLAGGGR